MLRSCALVFVLVTAAFGQEAAPLSLPTWFSDHMVFQRDRGIPVWGLAEPGSRVFVELASSRAEATAGEDGRWSVRLDALAAGGPHTLSVGSGGNELALNDVMVGEVWVCSGQSNMWWSVERCNDAKAEIAAASHAMLRLCTIPLRAESGPVEDLKAGWVRCSPETVAEFSAVAYFFGRRLRETIDVPIGLIHCSWGGSSAEAWTTLEKMNVTPQLSGIVPAWEARQARARAAASKRLEVWKEKVAAAEASGEETPKKPRGHRAPPNQTPAALYNGMLHGLMPFGIRGVIWYQGESNAKRAWRYRDLFPAMIRDWRERWGQGDFPFLFVQLANFTARMEQPGPSNWAELREAQASALSLPATGMAVTIDIGEAKDIHPRNKQDVGGRLALSALEGVYGHDVVGSGPTYASHEIDGSRIRLHLSNLGGGLVAKGEGLPGFAVAGADRKFVWAEARIEGDAVVVSSPEVTAPVAVRYGWANNPDCRLFNRAGLPASPFRTDDWRISTYGID